MTAVRLEGWELRLSAVIEAARARPFAWGRHDCALWAAEIVEALTGCQVMTDWRGRYGNGRGARRYLRALGFADIEAAVSARLGAPLASVWLAMRGDIVLAPDGHGLGVCAGREALFLAPSGGLTALPLGLCQMAWSL